TFPSPAPGPAYGSTMAAFNGTTTAENGTWNLYVVDDCQVDSGSVTSASVTITAAATTSFSTVGGPFTITDCCPAKAASLYPSPIAVSSVTGTISGMTVTLKGFTHTNSADVNALLVGPAGQKVVLMSDTGGAASSADITFAEAGSSLPATGAVTTGTYVPTDRPASCAGPTTPPFPAPAPAG